MGLLERFIYFLNFKLKTHSGSFDNHMEILFYDFSCFRKRVCFINLTQKNTPS